MTIHPLFVPGGVYLCTSTGELIGRLDKPGAPFATLDEAQSKLDWLELMVQFQPAQRLKGLGESLDRPARRACGGGRRECRPK